MRGLNLAAALGGGGGQRSAMASTSSGAAPPTSVRETTQAAKSRAEASSCSVTPAEGRLAPRNASPRSQVVGEAASFFLQGPDQAADNPVGGAIIGAGRGHETFHEVTGAGRTIAQRGKCAAAVEAQILDALDDQKRRLAGQRKASGAAS